MSETDKSENMSSSELKEMSHGDKDGLNEKGHAKAEAEHDHVGSKKRVKTGRIAKARVKGAKKRKQKTGKGPAVRSKARYGETKRKAPRGRATAAKRRSKKGVAKMANGKQSKMGAVRGISRNEIRRLAEKAGVKRASSAVAEEGRKALKAYLMDVVRDTVAKAGESKRNTIQAEDVTDVIQQRNTAKA